VCCYRLRRFIAGGWSMTNRSTSPSVGEIGRRGFFGLAAGALGCPIVARAQQPERVRRIGVLLATAADDAEHQAWIAAFHQGLALLKQIAPDVTRVAVLRDPSQAGTSQFTAIQTVAPALRMEVNPVNVRDAGEIERAVAGFARSPNGGLIVTSGPATLHRDLI